MDEKKHAFLFVHWFYREKIFFLIVECPPCFTNDEAPDESLARMTDGPVKTTRPTGGLH